MSSNTGLVLDVAVMNTVLNRYRKKQRIVRPPKKKVHIYSNESAKVLLRWKEVKEPWNFASCEAFLYWYHISRGFPHS